MGSCISRFVSSPMVKSKQQTCIFSIPARAVFFLHLRDTVANSAMAPRSRGRRKPTYMKKTMYTTRSFRISWKPKTQAQHFGRQVDLPFQAPVAKFNQHFLFCAHRRRRKKTWHTKSLRKSSYHINDMMRWQHIQTIGLIPFGIPTRKRLQQG